MRLNKPFFAFLIILFCCRNAIAQEDKIIFQPEFIYGHAKTVIETIQDKKGTIKIQRNIINVFDEKQTFVRCYTADTTKESTELSIEYMNDKYIKPISGQDTIGKSFVFVFDQNANKVGLICKLKDGKKFFGNKYQYGNLNLGDKLTEICIYNSMDTLVFKQDYVFDKRKNLLIEVDNYLNGKKTTKTIIKYIAFDKNGNWTRKVETKFFSKAQAKNTVITTRKITYY